MVKLKFKEQAEEANLVKLDLGCGKLANTPEGFIGVDKVALKGVKVVDLTKKWPWKNNSVDEAQANYLVHYLTAAERVHFVNELYRVLKPGAKCLILTPMWSAAKGYGDVMAQWPPVSEAWLPWLNKAWRDGQNHVSQAGYTCDFDHTAGYGLHPSMQSRAQEYQQQWVNFGKEAAQDLVATLIKR